MCPAIWSQCGHWALWEFFEGLWENWATLRACCRYFTKNPVSTLWKNSKDSFTKYPLGTLWTLCQRTKGVCSKSTHWVLCWVLFKSAQHLPAGYEPGELMSTFWKWSILTCWVFCWVNWWVLFKSAHYLPPGFGLRKWMGTFWKCPPFTSWVWAGQIVSEPTMNSQCTHWVYCPLPPVSSLDPADHLDDGDWVSGAEYSSEDGLAAQRSWKRTQGNQVFPGGFGRQSGALLQERNESDLEDGRSFYANCVGRVWHIHQQVTVPYWLGGNSFRRGTPIGPRGQGRQGKMED